MNKINYQLMLDHTIKSLEESSRAPSLLLQCCCAPCSSYVLEYLNRYFRITAYYYNPNISPAQEYFHRAEELKRLASEMDFVNEVSVKEEEYDPELFFEMARGMEDLPEGGERCMKCYELRLRKTAETAKLLGFDYFTTTLSISPLKKADKLNEIGAMLEKEYGVRYLYSDFKKKGGYQRSVELSEIHGLYRQDYCGCVYSKGERDRRLKEREEKHM